MMNNNKNNKLFAIILFIYSFIILILGIINISKLSSNVEEYKNLKKILLDYKYNLVSIYNYYSDSENKIINDFINLETNEKTSSYFRMFIPIYSIIFFFLFLYILIKNNGVYSDYNNNNKCYSRFCCYNLMIIFDMILVFYAIIDSITMFNYRKNRIIPYIKLFFVDNSEFESRVKTCKTIDLLFIIFLLIFIILIILLEISLYKKTNYCCKKNESREINPNQIYNQPYLYNPNYNNNIYNGNQQLVYPVRNISNGQYIVVFSSIQNSNNNLNPNRNEILREISPNNNNNNNINNENNRINNRRNNRMNNIRNNEENFLDKILNVCNRDKFDKNKYKGHEDCRICLMKFEKGNKIIILPCLHIFHEHCLINWLNNKKTCPLDNQSLENYI